MGRALDGRPVALLGLRGSGKTTVGRLLAARLGRPFLDLDEELVTWARHAGEPARSAGELLASRGERRFRELESDVLRRVLEPRPRLVVATGGGVVDREDNRVWLERVAWCVWISVPIEVLERRLALDPGDRPALTGLAPATELRHLLARRAPLLEALADLVVEAGDAGPEELADRIALEFAG